MIHPLTQWREANRYSQTAFAKLLLDQAKLKVTQATVNKWEHGAIPRKPKRMAIEQVTGGQVTSASFL